MRRESSAEIEKLFANALHHHKRGQLREAERLYARILAVDPNHSRALHFLGVLSHQSGRSDVAVELIGRAIASENNVPDFHYNLGVVLEAIGRLDAAEAHYRNATDLDPAHPGAHLNLGNALLSQGKLDAAETASRRALALNSQRPEAHFNLGLTLTRQGRYNEAIRHFRNVLNLVPNFAAAHAGLGAAFMARGEFEQAAQHCQRSLDIEPRNHLWAVNLGLLCLARGDHENALGAALRALDIEENPQTKFLFARAARFTRPTAEDARFRELIRRALAECWGRPAHLVLPALSLVKMNPGVKAAIEQQRTTWPQPLSIDRMCGPSGLQEIAGDSLLVQLLRSGPIFDAHVERMFTGLRRGMLELATERTQPAAVTADVLQLFCALAQQCFINEYVYAASEAEWRDVNALDERLAAALRHGEDPPSIWIALVGAYLPLDSSRGAQELAKRTWSAPVAAVAKQQMEEPLVERELRASLPSLTTVDDDVSTEVKRQYEENPYPRWIGAWPVPTAATLDAHLAGKFPHAAYVALRKTAIDVLVAGCGTGLHAIETAQQYIGADVLAIDLSAASLAYAARKTREMGLTNVRYAVADILRLDTLGLSFDLIEASGVLHHLADPRAAWRLLLSILRPGGVMNVGLYSELARTDVVRGRAFITERGYPASAEGVRRCREDMLACSDDPLIKEVSERTDFFTASSCRDLMFHVQESRVTLPQIAEFIAENRLTFLGFDADPELLQGYASRFPVDRAKTDLASWHQFELENPRSFAGMYQFWVQKN